ncbi:MAG: hypothetical protein CVT47_00280 [Thermoplasmata archaeon HGW-Thermoplasmata-2]|nr:MAG: hypothetical protein CVT47_00280 [Thermoplasmata archaeon HGW-Thermoplasmata-2]
MKPKVGIYGFTGCAGCQLEILNLEDILLDIVGAIDIVNFRMAKSKNDDSTPLDVAVIEGSIVTKEQEEEIKKIRDKTKILIAAGDCACFGGVQRLTQFGNLDDAKKLVYGNVQMKHGIFHPAHSRSIEEIVKVDLKLPCCPMVKEEFVEALKCLLAGKKIDIKPHAVCEECRKNGVVCFFEKGHVCMGTVTLAGCGALCPSNGYPCEGCRGPVEEANIPEQVQRMRENGLSDEDINRKFRKFTSGAKEFANALEIAKAAQANAQAPKESEKK